MAISSSLLAQNAAVQCRWRIARLEDVVASIYFERLYLFLALSISEVAESN